MIQPVILCGGSGTRLWPLSRKALPKQFVELIQGKSLLALTIERVAPLRSAECPLVCVGSAEHQFLLKDLVQRTPEIPSTLILEPCARNTAAAMTLAALQADGPQRLQLFCPSDHHIPDAAAFSATVMHGIPAALAGAIVLFGVMPSHPTSAYGYIECGDPQARGGFGVRRFVEKPPTDVASELILGGHALWNAGVFLCTAGALLEAMATLAPDILAQCRRAMESRSREDEPGLLRPAAEPLQGCRAESIDKAVIERHERLAVIPFAGHWSDVGSWSAVAALSPSDASGNRIDGNGVALMGTGNYIHAPSRPVVALGTHNLIIVDTPDAVLVADGGATEQVKSVVQELERRGRPQATQHRKVVRPWGSYDCVDVGPRFQVKRIIVNPSASLSLQKHFHRAEHWVVVRGTAMVTKGNRTFLLTENQSTYIPIAEVHRLSNPGKTPLELIEVQSGDYLGEDDIVRLQDDYGRQANEAGGERAEVLPRPRPDERSAPVRPTLAPAVMNGQSPDLTARRLAREGRRRRVGGPA